MKRNFQKLINNLDADELREELTTIYDRFDIVRKYYAVELSADTSVTVEKYKKKLHQLFFPNRGRGKRARSNSSKLLAEFKSISVFPEDLIELHFYRTELMLAYIHRRRLDGEAYYRSAVAAYRKSCEAATKAGLEDRFREEARTWKDTFIGRCPWPAHRVEVAEIFLRFHTGK